MVQIQKPTKIMNKDILDTDVPTNNQVLTFVSANDDWEALSNPGAGEANTSSNSGAGDGWALAKVAVDLPFKSLIVTSPITVTVNAADLTLTFAVTTTIDMTGNDLDNIQNLIHDISTSGTDIDFSEDEVQTISISANTTFTTANRAAGKSKLLKITTDSTLRTLTFPAWDWVSDIPANQAASKNGYLTLTSFSTTDAAITAAYQVGSL